MREVVWLVIAIATLGWMTIISFYLIGSSTLLWMLGNPVTVRESEQVTGYIKWFTFYPKVDK